MVSINDVLKASKRLHVDDIFAELWGRKLSGGYTIDVYTGTLPATLTGTKAGYLHRYKIYGDMEQTGTPTPENPIVPQECGERTENLFDEQYPGYAVGSTIKYRPIYVGQGTFTLSTTFPQMTDYADLFFFAGNVSTGGSTGNDGVWSERPIAVESIDGYVTVAYRRFSASHPNLRDYNTMLNLGSTPLPYEPYGYKLPLASAGQDVDIYLGESQSTRRIKKLVLTGQETWNRSSSYVGSFYAYLNQFPGILNEPILYCSHLLNVTELSQYQVGKCFIASASVNLWIFDESTTVANFKSYLAAQYANGTPVTVWYVLATEETGTLNEPLRKIGDYADTIDSTQTSAQIPSSAGSTTISWAGSGLAPSEVEFEYERRR